MDKLTLNSLIISSATFSAVINSFFSPANFFNTSGVGLGVCLDVVVVCKIIFCSLIFCSTISSCLFILFKTATAAASNVAPTNSLFLFFFNQLI